MNVKVMRRHMSQICDYECVTVTTNVRPKFSNVQFVLDNMEIPDFCAPPNFTNVPFFQFFLSCWRPEMKERSNPTPLWRFWNSSPDSPDSPETISEVAVQTLPCKRSSLRMT